MIKLESFQCTYRGASSPAIREVSIEISEGEALAVVGARGSGKTTLALAAAGLLPLLYDCETTGRSGPLGDTLNSAISGVLTGEVGFLPERPAAALSGLADTVFAEVAMALRNRGRAKEEVDRAVNTALENVGIIHLASRHPFQLSGGEQKLVGLASALAQGSRQIVFDCPFAGLDRNHILQFAAAIARYCRLGGAVLVTERRLTHVTGLICDVWLLDEGRQVSRIHTLEGVPRRDIDLWRRAGLPAASMLLVDRGGVDPIPVRFAP